MSPTDVERFYLRLLLLNVSGAQSFDDLKTVDGEICETFQDTAAKRQLLLDDLEYSHCLEEAVFFKMPSQLRELFSVILLFGSPSNPLELWTSFSDHFCDDYRHRYTSASADDIELMCYDDVNQLLSLQFKTLDDFGIKRPSDAVVCRDVEPQQQQLNEAVNKAAADYQLLNDTQRHAVDSIMAAVEHTSQRRCFFLDGPGGKRDYLSAN